MLKDDFISVPFHDKGGSDTLQLQTEYITDSHALEHVYFKTLGFCQKSGNEEVSESSKFLMNLADFLQSNESILDGGSALRFFSEPVLICDFSVDRDSREYSSQIIHPYHANVENKSSISQLRELFEELYSPEQFLSLSDQLVNDYLDLGIRGEVSDDIHQLEKDDNPALNQFLSILAFHLDQTSEDKENIYAPHHLNSFARASLKNLQNLMENGSSNAGKESNSSLDGYPFFGVKEVGEGSLVCISISHLDPIFIDDRVEEGHRLPKITFAVFDISETKSFVVDGFPEWLVPHFRHLLCSLTHTVIAERRREAIETAAGEAAEISRYWNSQGLLNLMQEDEKIGSFLTGDTFDFWERFVKELLCANIPGVKNVETFPFDRAILVSETGVQESDIDNKLRIRVLESAVKCEASEHLNKYFTSRERVKEGIDLDNFDLTDKLIKQVNEITASYLNLNDSKDEIEFCDESGLGDKPRVSFNYSDKEVVDESTKINQQIYALFGVLCLANDSVEGKQEYDVSRKKAIVEMGQHFNDEGISYTYCHGIDLRKDIQNLFDLNECLGVIDGAKEKSELENKKTWAKVVYVSFEPLRHNRNIELEKPLAEGERVTLILIADDDPAKSTQDIDAERKDLELLITTVIRQKFRDAERKISAFSKQSEVIRSSLGQFGHNLKDASAEAKRAVVDQVTAINSMLDALEGRGVKNEHFKKAEDILKFLSSGIKVDGENVDLATYASHVVAGMKRSGSKRLAEGVVTPEVSVVFSVIPEAELKLPKGVVDEVFRVMFKNSVEAAAFSGVNKPVVSVNISIRPDTEGDSHSIEILIENSTKPLSKSLLADLNAREPKSLKGYKNHDKKESSGVGVYIARVMLQFGVGKGADLGFFMVSKQHIQTRMTIPCQIIPFDSESDVIAGQLVESSLNAEVLSQPYVLYVEDDEKSGESSFDFLKGALESKGIRVQWESALKEATSALNEKLPELLITDMNFSKSNVEKSNVGRKYGEKLLKTYFTLVNESDFMPPVWIVSGEEEKDIISFLNACLPFENSGYKIGAKNDGDLLEPGTVHVLYNVKDISESQPVRCALEAYGEYISENKDDVSITNQAVKLEVDYKEAVLNKSFSNLNKLLEKYVEENSCEYRNLHTFVISSHVETFSSLSKLVVSWHKSLGIPDPDFEDDGLVSLTSSDHKNIFLKVDLTKEIANYLRPKFYYWCFQNNIILTEDESITSELVSSWEVMYTTEVFGALRHDLRGLRGVEEVSRNELIEQVTKRELEVKLSDAELSDAEDILNGRKELGKCDLFVSKEMSFEEQNITQRKLLALREMIIEFGEGLREESYKNEMRSFAQRILELSKFITGGSDNE